ncbi:hypothetical protein pb186bvf_015090 [Paramecium bursaria]
MNDFRAHEKLPPRITHMKINIQVQGVFGFPDEWKQTDEDNKQLFQYQVAFLDSKLSGGKIIPREMTEKEKKEIEEAEAAKKLKKGGKKDTKFEPPKPTPEEEKARLLKEQLEQEEQAKLQAEWDALTEEEKIYKTYEDQFKNASIKFDQTLLSQELNNYTLVIQQERFRVDRGEWIFFYKSPTLAEEELAKLKKTKPKTLNLNDLNIIVFKAWIDYSQFDNPGSQESIQRIKFTQYLDETAPAETPKPNIDNMYMLINLRLSVPFKPVRSEPYLTFNDIIAPAPEPLPIPSSQQCINELRTDLQVIIESLAMEYSNMFGKEFNQLFTQKQSNVLKTHKPSDLSRRKEHFLYDFNISGKYKILKERIKKSIVRLCRDKFQRTGSVTGISTTQSDQFYSELYVFLMEEMRQVLINLVKENKEMLKEDFSQLTSKKLGPKDIGNQNIIEQKTGESRAEQLERLCYEYEILKKYDDVEKFYTELLELNKKDSSSLVRFAQFCLRTERIPKAEQLIEQALSFDGTNLSNQLLLAGIYYFREKPRESRMILELLLEKDPNNLVYTLFLYFVLQNNDQALSQSLYYKAERLFLRQLNLIPNEGNHYQSPTLYDIPWIKIPIPPPDKPEKDKAIIEAREQQRLQFELSHNQPRLNNEQLDNMFLELIGFFEDLNLLDVADKLVQLLKNQNHPRISNLSAKISLYKQEYQDCIQKYENLIEQNPGDISFRIQLIDLLFKMKAFDDCEFQIKFILPNPQLKEDFSQQFQVYLQFGYVYLYKREYQNARAVFSRTCQMKQNSSLSWLGLGISAHESGFYQEAEDALRMANLYEPKNDQVWGYISLNCLKDGQRFRDANLALREMRKTDVTQIDLLSRLSQEFFTIQQYQTSKELLQIVLSLSELQDVLGKEKIMYQIQLAETNEKLGLIEQSLEYLQEALINIEEEDLITYVKDSITRLDQQLKIKY